MTATRLEPLIPRQGTPFVTCTQPDGTDVNDHVHRLVRQTDQPEVWTIVDSARCTGWVRYDEVRRTFVRARGQKDGEPVPCE